jgi:DNA-binding SARP family transcriptional activator
VLFRFLDNPHVEVESRREMLASTKSVALLVYLACQQTWVTRDTLSALFSDDNTDSDALRQLRVILSRARKFGWAGTLELEDNRLRFKVQTDLQLFRQAIGAANWQEATALYRSEFLSGFQIQASGFEAWLEVERETLRQAWLEAALLYARSLAAQNDHLAASHLLQNILALDALSEDVLALYLEQQYLAGGRSEALKAFERFRDQLQSELSLEPLETTLKLVQIIRQAAPLETTSIASVGKSSVPLTILRPPHLIGRDAERATLETANQTVILVSGEPGSGKTRLLEEVLPRTRWLACFEGLENLPYQPLIAFLRSQLSRLPDLGVYSEDLARLIPEVLPNASLRTDDPISAKARLLEALARCFEAQAKPIVIDDLQWADASSLEFLSFLALRGVVRIFGTYRSSEVNPALGKTIAAWRSNGILLEIKLEPLTMADINTLLASLSGLEVGAKRFGTWLSKQSGGNPFFALETLKALFETEMLHEEDGTWTSQLDDLSLDYNELRVPSKVAAVIEQRVSRLSEPAKRALQAACVMRQGFTPKTLAGIVGLSEFAVLDALEEAQNSSLIAGDHFVHDLIRQGMYQNLPETRRKVLHGNIAQMLEHGAEPLVVAEHWLEAAAPDQAYPWLRAAAINYRLKGLLEETIPTLQKALECAPNVLETCRVQFDLARVYVSLSRIPEAQSLIDTVLLQTSDPELLALCLNTKAELLLHAGHISEAAQTSAQAFELCQKAGFETFELHTIGAEIATLEERYDDAIALLKPAIVHWQGKPASSELVSLLASLGAIYDLIGQAETGFKLHQEAAQVAKTIGDKSGQVSVAMNLLWCLMALNRYEEGILIGENALALGEYIHTAVLRNNLGVIYLDLERYAEARVHFEILTQNRDDPTLRCMAWARLARIYDHLKLETLCDQALEDGLALLDQTEYAVAHISVAISVLNLGTDEQVLRVKPYFRQEAFHDPPVQQKFEQAFEHRFGRPWLEATT